MQSKHLIQVAMMTTILVILGLIPGIPLGFIPVPIVLQNLGVMLAAILLGTKKEVYQYYYYLSWACLSLSFQVVE